MQGIPSGVSLLSHPAAVYFGTALEVYVEASNYQNYAIWSTDGINWPNQWSSLGGYPQEYAPDQYASGPALAAWPDASRIDEVVTSRYSNSNFDKYYTGQPGDCWSSCWQQVPGPQPIAASDPGIAWWPWSGDRRIEVFIQGADHNLCDYNYLMSSGGWAWVSRGAWPGGYYSGNAPAVAVWR